MFDMWLNERVLVTISPVAGDNGRTLRWDEGWQTALEVCLPALTENETKFLT